MTDARVVVPPVSWSARVALAAFVLASAAAWIALARHDPDLLGRQTDLMVYRAGGAAVWHGSPLYGVPLGPAGLGFTYPPFAGLLFAPVAAVSVAGWEIGLTALSGVALVVIARASARLAGRSDWTAAIAVSAVGLWLEPVVLTLHFGQLNLVLLALVLADVAAPNRRWSGLGVGLAAGVKLTPLIVIPYLWLIGRRRAAATALASCAVTVVLGVVALPSNARRYWLHLVGTPGDAPNRLVDQSLDGAVLRLLHRTSGAGLVWVVVAIAVGLVGLAAGVQAGRRAQPLLGICLVGVTGLLVSPVSWTHHWVWVVPMLALALDRRWPAILRTGWAAVVVILFGWWPTSDLLRPSGLLRLLPHDGNREDSWAWWQYVLGDYYVVFGMLLIAGGAVVLLRGNLVGTKGQLDDVSVDLRLADGAAQVGSEYDRVGRVPAQHGPRELHGALGR
jgi:alpha-1,2-mannosyltransferase